MPSSQSEEWTLKVWVLKYLPESLTRTFAPRSGFVTSGKLNAESLSVTPVLKRLCSLKSSYCQSLFLPSAGAGWSLPWRMQLGEVLGFQSSHSCREGTQVPQNFPTCSASVETAPPPIPPRGCAVLTHASSGVLFFATQTPPLGHHAPSPPKVWMSGLMAPKAKLSTFYQQFKANSFPWWDQA